jgi:hypothetical protein
MTPRYLLIVLGVALFGAGLVAQSPGSAIDPITGTWSGAFTLTDGNRHVPVKMQLTFDGKSAVTGTFSGLPHPGDVKTGSFDRKTRALALRLGRADGPAVLLVLEGKVEKATATGTFTGDESGTFQLKKE